jgi:DNA-binding XRE family transcriptional regulator
MYKIITAQDLKEWRSKHNLTQNQAANILGYKHRSMIHLIESGKRVAPKRLSMVFKFMPDSFVKENKDSLLLENSTWQKKQKKK